MPRPDLFAEELTLTGPRTASNATLLGSNGNAAVVYKPLVSEKPLLLRATRGRRVSGVRGFGLEHCATRLTVGRSARWNGPALARDRPEPERRGPGDGGGHAGTRVERGPARSGRKCADCRPRSRRLDALRRIAVFGVVVIDATREGDTSVPCPVGTGPAWTTGSPSAAVTNCGQCCGAGSTGC